MRGDGQPALKARAAAQRALDMGVPQRERIRVLRRDRELVGDRGRRTMPQPAARGRAGAGRRRWRARARRTNGTSAASASTANTTTPPRGRAAAARATVRARRPSGTDRRRSRASPAPATAAPRRSSSGRAAMPSPAAIGRPAQCPVLRAAGVARGGIRHQDLRGKTPHRQHGNMRAGSRHRRAVHANRSMQDQSHAGRRSSAISSAA